MTRLRDLVFTNLTPIWAVLTVCLAVLAALLVTHVMP
jgi:hypothetical protein